MHARVLLQALLGLPLVSVLRLLSLFLLQGEIMIVIFIFVMFSGFHQITANCKNCMMLGKNEKAMFRAHSDACRTQSQVEQQLIDNLLSGKLVNDPRLKKHVYCVLLKCKIISKDGKLQKAAVLGKMGTRLDGKNVTKVLENCANQPGESPEDLAWNLFRCGYDKKAVLFDFMPAGSNGTDENDAL